jgi:valyl-tRNA synthetase
VAVRNVRSTYTIPRSTQLSLSVRCEPGVAADLEAVASQFLNLSNTELIAVGPEVRQPAGAAGFALAEADGYIDLEGVVDREAERARHARELEKLTGLIAGHEKKLANENFVSKAPPDVVEGVRETLAGLSEQLERVNEILGQLGEG